MLVKDKCGLTPFHRTAINGHIDQAREFAEDVECLLYPDNTGKTALHFAARFGHLHQIPTKLLTEENLRIHDEHGITPLHEAEDAGRLDQLLGIEFSEELRNLVGEDWYNRNLEIIHAVKTVTEEKEEADVGLF